MCRQINGVVVDTVATGLDTPWDVAFLQDGTAFVTERPGRILKLSAGASEAESWLDVDAYSPEGSEIGLMGVDISPDEDWLYFLVAESGSTHLVARLSRRLNRILDPERGQLISIGVYRAPIAAVAPEAERVLGPIPSGFIHGGGALRFGPDGVLFVTNGDGGDHGRAQITTSLRGKLLSLQPPPPGAFPEAAEDDLVYASGLRHSQGITWTPAGRLLAIDHGPTGLDSEWNRTDHDELNSIERGDNLGWPIVAGASEGGSLVSPIVEWTPALAPGGLAWFDGPGTPWHNSVFVTGLRGTRLVRVEITETPNKIQIRCTETLLQDVHGRLRLVRQAPDGSLWIGTSNRDGRGIPREHDDVILRLRPSGPA